MDTPEFLEVPQDILYSNMQVYNPDDNQYMNYQSQIMNETNTSDSNLNSKANMFPCKHEFIDVKIEATETTVTDTITNDQKERNKIEECDEFPLSVQLHVGNKLYNTNENLQRIKCKTIENLQAEHGPNPEDESMAVEALRQLGNSLYSSANCRIETKTPHDLPLLPCLNCDMQFRTTADLNSHEEICKHSQYLCSICTKTFYRKLDLNNHLVCHAVERPHACRICSTLFVHKNDLQQHMATHGSDIVNQCQVCGQVFNRGSSLSNHMKIHSYQTERNVAPKIEGNLELVDMLTTEITETKSLENAGQDNQWNVYCETEFTPEVNEDVEVNREVVIGSEVKTFPCEKCDKFFDSAKSLSAHQIVHGDKLHICPICNTSFLRKQEFKRHMTTHDVLHDCTICGTVFYRPSSLTNHMKIHNYPAKRLVSNQKIENNLELAEILTSDEPEKVILPSINSMSSLNWNLYYESEGMNSEALNDTNKTVPKKNKKPYSCPKCDKTFAREKALKSHLILHEDVLETYFNCTKCEKTFNDDSDLKHHENQCVKRSAKVEQVKEQTISRVVSRDGEVKRTEWFKHECKDCEKRFNTKQKLFRHSWTHRAKTFTCEICAKSFKKQELLDAHRLATHQSDSLHICSDCGKNFASRQGLWEHRKMHSLETIYKCLECAKTFTSRQGYLIHNRKHRDERPYGCSYCWKAFRDGGTLRKHERIHTGERPHACPLCAKAFNQKVVLREHVRCMHVANMKPEEDNVFVCKICQEKIVEKDDLCAHFIKHSDCMARIAKNASKNNIVSLEGLVKEKFDCDLCGQTFANRDELHEHIRIHI